MQQLILTTIRVEDKVAVAEEVDGVVEAEVIATVANGLRQNPVLLKERSKAIITLKRSGME